MTRADPPTPAPATAAHYFDVLGTIACVALAVVTFGFAAFRFLPRVLPPGASANQDRAFFAAVNAFTLTGFQTTNVAVFPTAGRVLVILLAGCGAALSLIGGGYFLAAAMGLSMRTRTISLWSLGTLLAPFPFVIAGRPFDALSATLGLGITSSRTPDLAWRTIDAAISVPGVLGGVCVFACITGHWGRRDQLARTLAVLVGLYVGGAALLWLVGDHVWDATSWAVASAQSLNLRGLGLPGGLTGARASPWATVLLILPGTAPASTGGGLGVLPLVIIARAALDALRGRPVDRLVGVAIVWLSAFGAAIAAVVLALAAIEPSLTGERLLLLAVGSVCNVGVSVDPVGITGAGLFVLAAAMLVGRTLPIVMLCWAATTVCAFGDRPAPRADGHEAA